MYMRLTVFMPTHTCSQPSYVFSQREPTPAKHFKQTDYCSQLDSQVHRVQTQRQKAQELEDRLEREEQIKLSEE